VVLVLIEIGILSVSLWLPLKAATGFNRKVLGIHIAPLLVGQGIPFLHCERSVHRSPCVHENSTSYWNLALAFIDEAEVNGGSGYLSVPLTSRGSRAREDPQAED